MASIAIIAFVRARTDDIGGLAAELAYRGFLALFPFVILVASLSGVVADIAGIVNPTERIIQALDETLPPDVISVLRGQLRSIVESPNVPLLVFGIAGALWTASSAFSTVIKALNRVHAVREPRPWLKREILAGGLTVLTGGVLVAAVSLIIASQLFGEELAERIGLSEEFGLVVSIATWPITVLLIAGSAAFTYWVCPTGRASFRWLTPGAVFFTVSWLAMTYVFGLYFANFSSYNATYGVLGGAAATMVWLYLSSYALLAGAELNVLLEANVDPETYRLRRASAGGDSTEKR